MTSAHRVEIRIFTIGSLLVLLGTVLVGMISGWHPGISFLAGGLLAAANLAALRNSIKRAFQAGSGRPPLRIAIGYMIRLLLIPLCLYVMMRFLFLEILAAIVGFAAFFCAIFLEGLLEAFRRSSG